MHLLPTMWTGLNETLHQLPDYGIAVAKLTPARLHVKTSFNSFYNVTCKWLTVESGYQAHAPIGIIVKMYMHAQDSEVRINSEGHNVDHTPQT